MRPLSMASTLIVTREFLMDAHLLGKLAGERILLDGISQLLWPKH